MSRERRVHTGLLIGLAGCLCLSACTTRLGDFSMISTGSPQYVSMSSAPMQLAVEGKSARLWFLFLPLSGAPNIKEAVDQCLDKGRGDFMERARIYETDWTIFLFSYGSFAVKGDVGNSKFEQLQAR